MESFIVTAKFGHVRPNKFIIKSVPAFAENGKEAAELVRFMGRVKHHQKDAILSVTLATQEEVDELNAKNNSDSYFRCHNSSDQKAVTTEQYDLILNEPVPERKTNKTESRGYKKRKQMLRFMEAHKAMREYRDYIFDNELD